MSNEIFILVFWDNHTHTFEQIADRLGKYDDRTQLLFNETRPYLKENRGICIGFNFNEDGLLDWRFKSSEWNGYDSNQKEWINAGKASSPDHVIDFRNAVKIPMLTRLLEKFDFAVGISNQLGSAATPWKRSKSSQVFSIPVPLP